jgi:hypothetical protein
MENPFPAPLPRCFAKSKPGACQEETSDFPMRAKAFRLAQKPEKRKNRTVMKVGTKNYKLFEQIDK